MTVNFLNIFSNLRFDLCASKKKLYMVVCYMLANLMDHLLDILFEPGVMVKVRARRYGNEKRGTEAIFHYCYF